MLGGPCPWEWVCELQKEVLMLLARLSVQSAFFLWAPCFSPSLLCSHLAWEFPLSLLFGIDWVSWFQGLMSHISSANLSINISKTAQPDRLLFWNTALRLLLLPHLWFWSIFCLSQAPSHLPHSSPLHHVQDNFFRFPSSWLTFSALLCCIEGCGIFISRQCAKINCI